MKEILIKTKKFLNELLGEYLLEEDPIAIDEMDEEDFYVNSEEVLDNLVIRAVYSEERDIVFYWIDLSVSLLFSKTLKNILYNVKNISEKLSNIEKSLHFIPNLYNDGIRNNDEITKEFVDNLIDNEYLQLEVKEFVTFIIPQIEENLLKRIIGI